MEFEATARLDSMGNIAHSRIVIMMEGQKSRDEDVRLGAHTIDHSW
jgi:hypothetical protein